MKNSTIFTFILHSNGDQLLKEKNLLLEEQILSLKSRPYFGTLSSMEANKVMKVVPLVKLAGKAEGVAIPFKVDRYLVLVEDIRYPIKVRPTDQNMKLLHFH